MWWLYQENQKLVRKVNEDVIPIGDDFEVRKHDFYQIYWDEGQLPNLFPFAKPYKNEGLTPFFENDVIRKLVPVSTSDKIAVCSHALRQKIGNGIPLKEPFTEDTLKRDFQVLYLGRRSPEERMIWRLDQWHPGAGAILFKIFEKLGIPRPSEPKNPIYQNHFVAERSIYQDYVGQFLIPAMDLMENDEEIHALVNVDSGYYKLKPPFGDFAKRVKHFLGTDYAPLHAFILERCFSCWINPKPIKVTYL